MRRSTGLALALAAAAFGSGALRAADDDLAVVRKAVAANQAQTQKEAAAPKSPASKAQWFKVRVNGKTTKKQVTVNLPLSLVRAIGDDFPVDLGCHHHGRSAEHRHIKLGEILAALDAGQSLVEVDADDETVRIWVE
jgi:hypothetical protein